MFSLLPFSALISCCAFRQHDGEIFFFFLHICPLCRRFRQIINGVNEGFFSFIGSKEHHHIYMVIFTEEIRSAVKGQDESVGIKGNFRAHRLEIGFVGCKFAILLEIGQGDFHAFS